MFELDLSPANPVGDPAARDAQRSAGAERQRRVVEGLRGGVAMAEIARREGIGERELRPQGTRKWRRISLKTLETDSEMAGPAPSLTRG